MGRLLLNRISVFDLGRSAAMKTAFLEIPKSHIQGFATALELTGALVTIAEEERFFGDAGSVIVMVEFIPDVLSSVADAISIYAASRVVSFKINQKSVSIEGSAGSELKAEISQALSSE